MSQAVLWTALVGIVLATVGFDEVSAKVCYFGQEPDPSHNGRFRWFVPGTHEDHCRCTSIRRGGVNPKPQPRPYTVNFTEEPIFTEDVEVVHDFFGCHAITTDPPGKTTDLPSTTADKQITTTNDVDSTTDQPSVTTDKPSTTTDKQSTTSDHSTSTDGRPTDCQSLFAEGTNTSGVYTIYPSKYPDGLQVYCDMTKLSYQDINGGWIVFQRRQDGSVNFTCNWTDYRDGFGELDGEFWLGNERLRQLTEEGGWELLVELVVEKTDGQDTQIALYTSFIVTGDNYTLQVGNYDSDLACSSPFKCLLIADRLAPKHNNQNFSTYDRDNDNDVDTNCADQSNGGWWFNRCSDFGDVESNLNAEYSYHKDDWIAPYRGIGWHSSPEQIGKSEMKTRNKQNA